MLSSAKSSQGRPVLAGSLIAGALGVAALAFDGTSANAGPPTCAGKTATITQPNEFGQYVGTTGRDVIVSSALADTVDGRGGKDTICSLGGNDTVFGFDGGDKILAGADNDALYGEGGDDVLKAGDGNDFLVGSEGFDRCTGGPGDDTMGTGGGCEVKRGIENQ